MDDATNYLAQNLTDSAELTEGWILVKDFVSDEEDDEDKDPFQGITLMADRNTGRIVLLSTRTTKGADRWSVMPSMEQFKNSLLVLDLHKSRYLRNLDPSIGDLAFLDRLLLTRCSSLRELPDTIGKLSNLTEVRMLLRKYPEDNIIFSCWTKYL